MGQIGREWDGMLDICMNFSKPYSCLINCIFWRGRWADTSSLAELKTGTSSLEVEELGGGLEILTISNDRLNKKVPFVDQSGLL